MNGSVSQLNLALSRFFRMAVVAGVESAVRIHIERGDDLNARDSGGQTPLMLAAARNGNPPDKPKTREVEFSKKEVLREEVEIYRQPDHGCLEAS